MCFDDLDDNNNHHDDNNNHDDDDDLVYIYIQCISCSINARSIEVALRIRVPSKKASGGLQLRESRVHALGGAHRVGVPGDTRGCDGIEDQQMHLNRVKVSHFRWI